MQLSYLPPVPRSSGLVAWQQFEGSLPENLICARLFLDWREVRGQPPPAPVEVFVLR